MVILMYVRLNITRMASLHSYSPLKEICVKPLTTFNRPGQASIISQQTMSSKSVISLIR